MIIFEMNSSMHFSHFYSMSIPREKRVNILQIFLLCMVFFPAVGFAEGLATTTQSGRLSITIAPPLYQITIAPNTEWKSTLRVVNTNQYPLSIHVEVTDFHPNGETGKAVFDKLSQGDTKDTARMSGWISLPRPDITIAPDKSFEIPFSITVPDKADPGGHYAAILVGTKPPDHVAGGGASVGTLLSSLIFLRVPGDVVEEGTIRNFFAEKTVN